MVVGRAAVGDPGFSGRLDCTKLPYVLARHQPAAALFPPGGVLLVFSCWCLVLVLAGVFFLGRFAGLPGFSKFSALSLYCCC